VTGRAVQPGSLVIVFVSADTTSAVTVTVADDKGNSYIQSDFVNDPGALQGGFVFFLGNVQGGPSIFTATFGASNFSVELLFEEFTGIAATRDPRDGHIGADVVTPGNGANTISSGSITTTQDGDLVWGVCECVNSIISTHVPSVGTGFVLGQVSSGLTVDKTSEWQIQSAQGAIAATFGTSFGTTDSYTAHVIAFKSSAIVAPPLADPWHQWSPLLAQ